jgi:HNH endonuclease
MRDLTWSEARRLWDYDALTGVMTWRVDRHANKVAGKPVGALHHYGYLVTKHGGKQIPVHVLCWFWLNGEWPVFDIDHANGIGTDNRWHNLRLATPSENHANSWRPEKSSTGFKGVARERSGRYRASIKVAGRKVYLGMFDTAEAAHAVYAERARQVFGEYARCG